MANLEQLLDALDESRLRLLVAIESLPDEALLEKGVIGSWSIADILVNLTVWEAELVTGMMKLNQGKPASRMINTLNNPDAYDRLRYEENKDRDLDLIFDDLQQVRRQLEDWISEFSEKELRDRQRYPSLQGKSLLEVIAKMSYEHELLYAPKIETFTDNWLSETGMQSTGLISLSNIDLKPSENTHENTN